MSSVISARRLCDGRILKSSETYSPSIIDVEIPLIIGDEGLTSDSMADGDSESLILGDEAAPGSLELLGASEVARDMSSTSNGLICFPSEFV